MEFGVDDAFAVQVLEALADEVDHANDENPQRVALEGLSFLFGLSSETPKKRYKEPIKLPGLWREAEELGVYFATAGPVAARHHARSFLSEWGVELESGPQQERCFTVESKYLGPLGGKVRETFSVPSKTRVSELVDAVLTGMGWDDDHLWTVDPWGLKGFRLEDPLASPEEEPTSWDAIPIDVGVKFLFRFDFGDGHRFQWTVKKVENATGQGAKVRSISQTGRPPSQYGWGDDDEEE